MTTMTRKFAITAAAGLLFTVLTPAVSKADHRSWGGGGYYRGGGYSHRGGYYGGHSRSGFDFSIGFGTGFFRPYRSTYYCPPPRVYYAPPPVVYVPPPVSYYCAPPAYYAPAPSAYYCAPDSSYFSVRYHYGH